MLTGFKSHTGMILVTLSHKERLCSKATPKPASVCPTLISCLTYCHHSQFPSLLCTLIPNVYHVFALEFRGRCLAVRTLDGK